MQARRNRRVKNEKSDECSLATLLLAVDCCLSPFVDEGRAERKKGGKRCWPLEKVAGVWEEVQYLLALGRRHSS